MKKDVKIDLGSVQVDKKVFAEIISSALDEVDGVRLVEKKFGNKLFEMFGKDDFPGIDIKVDDNQEVTLGLRVVINYGMNIPDAARQVQATVKSAVDKTMDVSLKDINVNVQGIERGAK